MDPEKSFGFDRPSYHLPNGDDSWRTRRPVGPDLTLCCRSLVTKEQRRFSKRSRNGYEVAGLLDEPIAFLRQNREMSLTDLLYGD